MNRVVLGIVLIVVGFGIFMAYSGKHHGVGHAHAVRKIGEEALRHQVDRPDSVKFGDEWVGKVKDTDVLCGYYNPMDKSGAYKEQKRFITSGSIALTDENSAPIMDRMWADSCEPFRG